MISTQTVDEPGFLCCVLGTGEATLTGRGVKSLHNLRALENPQDTRRSSFLQSFSVNFRTGIVDAYLSKLNVIANRLGEIQYADSEKHFSFHWKMHP
jgi:hypothetical protein